LDILAEAMPSLMDLGVGFAVLGEGMEKYQRLCTEWAEKWPGRFAVRLAFDVPLSHRIETGCDFYLMPSRFEPCGLNQLYSLRYGTVPIVHATGGLEDTIEDISEDGSAGTGFKFRAYTSQGLLGSVQRAIALHGKADTWTEIMRRGMRKDFSWDRAAQDHLTLYRRLLA
jgi:starch synthase